MIEEFADIWFYMLVGLICGTIGLIDVIIARVLRPNISRPAYLGIYYIGAVGSMVGVVIYLANTVRLMASM